MNKKSAISFIVLLTSTLIASYFYFSQNNSKNTGAPPYGESEEQVPDIDPYQWIRDWKRPDGPTRVGLQVGHYKSEDAPDEQKNLRDNTGTSGGGKWEWEVNLEIAQETAKLLEAKGIVVDIIPTTVPEDYLADAFVAIHADGNETFSVNGYKVASPWRDWTQKSTLLANYLDDSYGTATNLEKDPNISRNMRGYYAFSWWRYIHAVHPVTPAAIVETGFLTNWSDQQILIYKPEIAAKGIADGIIKYLESQKLLPTQTASE